MNLHSHPKIQHMRITHLALLFLLLFESVSISQKNLPIIDVHLHAYNLWHPKSDTAWYPAEFKRASTDEELMRQSIVMMDKFNIVRAVASGDPATI